MKISVIISVYNYQKPLNLEAVIKSLKEQTIEPEIILSEQGEKSNSIYKRIAKKHGIKYIYSAAEKIENEIHYNIGKVRNSGASVSSGNFLYFSDSDVVFFNKDYLKKIIQLVEEKEVALARPRMFRLNELESNYYIYDYISQKKISYPKLSSNCLVAYDISSKTIENTEMQEYKEMINGTPHVCTEGNYNLINGSTSFDISQIEEFLWMPTYHYGGVCISKKDFKSIGGYAQTYYDWGLEDDDLQWKIKETVGLEYLFDHSDLEFSTLHIEHSRNYNNCRFEKNRLVFENRKKQGLEEVILTDRKNYQLLEEGGI